MKTIRLRNEYEMAGIEVTEKWHENGEWRIFKVNMFMLNLERFC